MVAYDSETESDDSDMISGFSDEHGQDVSAGCWDDVANSEGNPIASADIYSSESQDHSFAGIGNQNLLLLCVTLEGPSRTPHSIQAPDAVLMPAQRFCHTFA